MKRHRPRATTRAAFVAVLAGLFTATPALLPHAAVATDSPSRGVSAQEPERARQGEHRGRTMVQEWMEALREKDPDEFERLDALRREQPHAFRMELRERVYDARIMQRVREVHPEFHDFLAALPREERAEIGELWREITEELQPRRPRRERSGSWAQEYEEAARALIQTWHEAEDADAKAEARNALRNMVAETFDRRTEEQTEDMRQAEEQLNRLREILEQRRQRRDRWIERTLNHLLSDPDVRDETERRPRRLRHSQPVE